MGVGTSAGDAPRLRRRRSVPCVYFGSRASGIAPRARWLRSVDVADLQRALAERGIACTTPDGALRFSPHWPNDPDTEIPRVLAAIDAALGNP